MDEEKHHGWPYQLDDPWRPGDELIPQNKPDNWMTAAEAVAWVVWREWVPSEVWDTAFYPGAREWLHPAYVQDRLRDIANGIFQEPMASWPEWLARVMRRQEAMIHSMGADEFLRGVTCFRTRREFWPKAAQFLIDWIDGEWEHDYGILATLAQATANGGPAPDPALIDWAGSIGGPTGYSRCVGNYGNIWKGAEALRRSLAAGHVAAFGIPTGDPRPNAREQIPASTLSAPVAICRDTLLPCTPSEAWHVEDRPPPTWSGILLDASAVVAHWPAYVALPETNDTTTRAAAPISRADAWMAKYAAGRKREDAIRTCSHETGQTYRACEAAWMRQPDGIRGRRGVPKGG